MSALKITSKKEADGVAFSFTGILDERADLSEIANSPSQAIIFNFEGIERLNSYGVKKWMQVILSLAGRKLIYRNCQLCIVEQLNVITDLTDNASVESFYIPLSCTCTDAETRKLVTVTEALAPDFISGLNERYPCGRCDRKLQFADDEALYFDFLRAAKRAAA